MQKTGVAWKEAKTLSTFSPKRQLSFSTSVLSQQIHASKNICKACAVYLIGSRFPVPRVAVCVADPSVSGPVVDSVGHPRITRMVHQRLVPPSATSSEVIRCLYVWYCLVVVSPSVGCFNCHSKYIYIYVAYCQLSGAIGREANGASNGASLRLERPDGGRSFVWSTRTQQRVSTSFLFLLASCY